MLCLLLNLASPRTSLFAQPVWQQFDPKLAVQILSAVHGEIPLSQRLVADVRQYRYGGVDRLVEFRSLFQANWEQADAAKRFTLAPCLLRIDELIDSVCRQRFAAQGERPLFWHSDWKEAQAASRQRRVPILTLFLEDDLRQCDGDGSALLFATCIYGSPPLANWMRENLVLYVETDTTTRRFLQMEDPQPLPPLQLLIDVDGHPIDAQLGLSTAQHELTWLQDATRRTNAILPERVPTKADEPESDARESDKRESGDKAMQSMQRAIRQAMQWPQADRLFASTARREPWNAWSERERVQQIALRFQNPFRAEQEAMMLPCLDNQTTSTELQLHMLYAKIRRTLDDSTEIHSLAK